MIVYSLATQSMDTGKIDVTLYLTDWQAYEALANDLMPWDEDSPESIAKAARLEGLKARLHKEGVTAEIAASFRAALKEADMVGLVTKHDHPWTFEEGHSS